MVEARDEERQDVRPREGAQLQVRTEYTVGTPGRLDGWWAFIDADGQQFYEAGPFRAESEARESAGARLRVFAALSGGGSQELLREESVPPESSRR